MTLKFYHLKTCDTCRKALKALKAAGHEIEAIDVRADGVPPETLKKWVEAVGYEALLNTRSTTWRSLDAAQTALMTEAKAVQLMTDHPTLIKRPVIAGDTLTVGWKQDAQKVWI